jgi:hypothetical protein
MLTIRLHLHLCVVGVIAHHGYAFTTGGIHLLSGIFEWLKRAPRDVDLEASAAKRPRNASTEPTTSTRNDRNIGFHALGDPHRCVRILCSTCSRGYLGSRAAPTAHLYAR